MKEILYITICSEKELDLLDLTLGYAHPSWKKYPVLAIVKSQSIEEQSKLLFEKQGFECEVVSYDTVLLTWRSMHPIEKEHGTLDILLNLPILSLWYAVCYSDISKAFKFEADISLNGQASTIMDKKVNVTGIRMVNGTSAIWEENSPKHLEYLGRIYKLFGEELSKDNLYWYYNNYTVGAPVLFVKDKFCCDKYEQALANLDNDDYWYVQAKNATRWHTNYLDERLLTMCFHYSMHLFAGKLFCLSTPKPDKITPRIAQNIKLSTIVHPWCSPDTKPVVFRKIFEQ